MEKQFFYKLETLIDLNENLFKFTKKVNYIRTSYNVVFLFVMHLG